MNWTIFTSMRCRANRWMGWNSEALWQWFHLIHRLHVSIRSQGAQSLNKAVVYILDHFIHERRYILSSFSKWFSLKQRPEQRGQRSWHIFTMRLILAHKRHGSPRRTWFDPKPSEWADHHLPLGQKLQRIPGIPPLQLQRRRGERTSHRSLAAWEKTASPAKELRRLSARTTCAVIHYCSHWVM